MDLLNLLMVNRARKIEIEVSYEEFMKALKDTPRRYKKSKGTEFVFGTNGRVIVPEAAG